MSTFYQQMFTCAMCGKESEHMVMGSTSAFGAMDLDTRPPALERHTIGTWVQACPHCGYAYYNISDKSTVDPAFLQSEEYKAAGGLDMDELAKCFYREATIHAKCGEPDATFSCYLHAAWACDDAHKPEAAIACRLKALEVLQNASSFMDENTATIMQMDLLRRTNQFNKVLEFRDKQLPNSFVQSLLEYEIKLAEAKDARCHTVDDAEEIEEPLTAINDIPVGTKLTIKNIAELFSGAAAEEAAEDLEDADEEDAEDVIAIVTKMIPAGTIIDDDNIDLYCTAIY